MINKNDDNQINNGINDNIKIKYDNNEGEKK